MSTTTSGPRNDPMPEPEHAALRAWLLAHGLTAAEVQAAVGTAALGRSRAQVEAVLRAWLQTLPT